MDKRPVLTSDDLIATLSAMVHVIVTEAPILSALDAAIGDGDHGVNMVVGFRAVEEEVAALAGYDIETILSQVGTTIMAASGGASGPLYGAAFMEAAKAAGRVHTVDVAEVAAMLEGACAGVARRGRSSPGEKTMLDTLAWAAREARRCATGGIHGPAAVALIARAAAAGALSTRDMLARRGRAMRLRERTLNHLDPGAASCYLLIATACEGTASLGPLMQVDLPA